MIKKLILSKFVAAFFAIALFALASQSAKATTIVIQNSDKPNEGFNDPTQASPVGNNTGTTLGQQRLNAFQFAANIWGATLNSSVTIVIDARWPNTPNDPDPLNRPLPCSANSATLGSAGTISILAGFPNAPQAGTWYPVVLANAFAGTDLDPNNADIRARFNINLGTANCLPNSPFYLGLDNNHGSGTDLVTVLLHEFSHGLGFQTFTDPSNGTQAGSTTKRPSIFDNFLFDNSTGKTWSQMTDAERQASAVNNGHLTWNGAMVTGLVSSTLGTPRLRVNSPPAVAGNYTVGTADFGPALNSGGTTGNIVSASPANACTALTNGSAISGRLALIDRGACNFDVKVQNAQNAGAVGVIVVNNDTTNPTAVIQMGGATTSIDVTIAITTVMISLNDGNTLKAQLSGGLNGTLLVDTTAPGGADGGSRPLMYAPTTLAPGSSVSHWDTSEFPNQLMEPNISGDLTHSVAQPLDLTVAQLRDVGWPANPIGDNPFFVRQQYLDFLNRQPDSSGFAFWTNNIFNCGLDQQCVEVHRINGSAAFFLSIEFQDTGNLVYKMWKAGFRDINPPTVPVPVRRVNFIRDMQTAQSTPNQIIVGQGNWQANLEANKQAFALSFVQRAGFPSQSDAASFVGNLFANAGVTPTTAETNAAINAFNAAGGGNAGRAAALRSVCDSASVTGALRNEAFVLMQYFGYLQRDPDAQTPADYSGYTFWLNKLNSFNGNFIAAEMVKAFLASDEYRHRFGS
ncbi:MAG TPA: PA domain-containing protein [Pyrinomonadaceae bacterium]|nr:PA domain-containing protein [Pyrinomonadaceae bacterium]